MVVTTQSHRRGLCALIAVIAGAGTANADIVYQNDFEGLVGAEWSNTTTSVTPVGSRGFLGEFGNDTVSLDLAGLPAHDSINVSFELFIIRTWDGNGDGGTPGPDVWMMDLDGTTPLVNTTFAVGPDTSVQRQLFSGMNTLLTGTPVAPRTGASENDTLGYTFNGLQRDSVYNFHLNIPHTGDALTLDFSAAGLQKLSDESWGLDNVVVEAVPAPGVMSLLGLAGLATRRRR